MTDKVNVIVFHAKDSEEIARKIQLALQESGIQSTTLLEFSEGQKFGNLGDLYTLAIDTHRHVVCVVSQGLFANCNLAYAIGRAFGQGKVISAINPKIKVIMPTWYKSALKNTDKTLSEVILSFRLIQ